ncbi:MAG: glycosyltransferase, partial [Alphaproteobacteria bacterium]|nr:glycosyltransferase [Alphaproteobacteria bacterium]
MFRRRRSEGVASPRKDEGDLARDQGDWARAAEAYQAHLQHAPEDFDIWVQLGHARKEEGRYADALVAYSRARRLKPRDHDLLLNLGHLHKRMGHLEAAVSFYEQSAGLGNPHARDELMRVATPPRTTESPLQRAAPDAPRPAHQPPQPPEWPRLRAGPDNWPPERLDGFWITQTLRDFIIHGYGEAAVPYYWFLCSVMARRRDKPETFPESEECAQILDRVKTLSAELARSDGPLDATVIIPVFNNFLDTLLCLSTVLETAGERRFEVVVADDGSSDATASLIPTLGGVVRYLRQPQNLGFLRNCNVAAETARGAHVVLLNNDTLVLPAWLDRLLAPFEAFPSVGLTGSKLINWDGTLQEAGGIFWD